MQNVKGKGRIKRKVKHACEIGEDTVACAAHSGKTNGSSLSP